MKNLTYFLFIGFALSLTFSSCSKKSGCTDPNSLNYDSSAEEDDGSCTYPVAQQNALVFKSTSTGCSYCGEWGAEFTDYLLENHPNLDFVALYSSPFQADIAIALKKELGFYGTPHFWVGNESKENNLFTISSGVSNVLANEPEVGIQVKHALNGSKMTVNVSTKREESSSGDYNLAVYILEDHQIAGQSVRNGPYVPDWEHNHIIRREVSGAIFGIPISSNNNVTSNFEIDLGELELLSENIVPENCYPLAVIWRNESGSFKYVNSNR